METNLRRALTISNGDWRALVHSPLAIGLWALAVTGFVLPFLVGKRVKARMARAKGELAEAMDAD